MKRQLFTHPRLLSCRFERRSDNRRYAGIRTLSVSTRETSYASRSEWSVPAGSWTCQCITNGKNLTFGSDAVGSEAILSGTFAILLEVSLLRPAI